MNTDRQRVLVTGGTGFIGASLVRDLLRAGHEVHLTMRASSSRWRLTGVEHVLKFHQVDLMDEPALRRVVSAVTPDVIYHLAGHGVYPSQKERNAIFAANVLATGNLLSALEGHDYKRLVHAGSSAEYGYKNGPLTEDDPPQPRNDYGVAKASATLLCQAEAFKGRPVTTVRIFTAYGPWETLPRLVPYVMDCCRRGEPPQLTSGRQRRDFIFVQDVVELLQHAATHPGAAGKILHAATGQTRSVREAVAAVLSLGNTSLAPVFGSVPRQTGEPEDWSASIERTTEWTGWRPRFDLRSGLEQTWAWFQSWQSAAA
jgi:nucleoside-diphosphate-sugar epimerase